MKISIFFISLFLIFSCKKAEKRSCFKSAGQDVNKIIELQDFQKLKLKKKLKYILVQNDSTYLKILGGKNLVNFVHWKISDDGFLEIFNDNKCNFLRDQKNVITVEINFKNLNEIMFEGSETLECKDTLELNTLRFVVLDACGTFNLKLKANFVDGHVSYGWGDYSICGIVQSAILGIKSNGYCHLENLKVLDQYELFNESFGDMHIHATNSKLSGYIAGQGNIFYKGTPLSNKINIYGKGKLIAQ